MKCPAHTTVLFMISWLLITLSIPTSCCVPTVAESLRYLSTLSVLEKADHVLKGQNRGI